MSKIDISQFVKSAQELEEATGIPASVTLGQLILESSSSTSSNGLSGLARNAKNLFGIKAGSSWNGATYSVNTNEEIDGKNSVVKASFRKYNSYEDSIADYGNLLTSDRYKKVINNSATVEDFVKGIKNAGYATDSNYVNKVLNVIKNNNLNKYNASGNNTTMTAVWVAENAKSYGKADKRTFGVKNAIWNTMQALKNKASGGSFTVSKDSLDDNSIPDFKDIVGEKLQSELKNGITIILVLLIAIAMVIFLLKSLDINVGEVIANAKRI
jgi:flagellar protein FlgJ